MLGQDVPQGLHDERGPPRSFAGYRLALSVFDKMVLVTMHALDSTIAGGFCGLCRGCQLAPLIRGR
jgi:hypothetical protein